MMEEIACALIQLYDNPSVHVILIESAHQKFFCAGADVKQLKSKDYQGFLHAQLYGNFLSVFKDIKKPIIAAVNGKTLGGGFQFVLMCDIIVCSEKAYFILPESNIGMFPGMGGSQNLPKVVGEKQSMKMILSSQGISGQEAGRLGLGQFISKDKIFQEQVNILAHKIASKSLAALISAKRAVKQASQTNLSQGLAFEKATFYSLLSSAGSKQGIRAFFQKRKPNFKGT